MFRKDTVTPVRHATNGLDTTCSMWGWFVWGFDRITEIEVEALPKLPAYPVPMFTGRMIWKYVMADFAREISWG